jgi:hypothetical protein
MRCRPLLTLKEAQGLLEKLRNVTSYRINCTHCFKIQILGIIWVTARIMCLFLKTGIFCS